MKALFTILLATSECALRYVTDVPPAKRFKAELEIG